MGEGDSGRASSASGSETRRPSTPAPPPRLSTSPPPPAPPAAPANYRLVIAALWLAIQIGLVATAGRRADGAFGFRMFSESSTIRIALFRELTQSGHPARVHVESGEWAARGPNGLVRQLSWYDRVPAPRFVFDKETHASYGAAAQVQRFQAALDDLSTHLPDDAETQRFVAVVTIRKNGHEPTTVQLVGPDRRVPALRESDGP